MTPAAQPPTPALQPGESVCPRCSAHFRCGMAAGDSSCWCASLPPVLPVPAAQAAPPAGASCFCPACLACIAQATPTFPIADADH